MEIYDFVSYKSHGLFFLCYSLDGFQRLPQCPKLPFISVIKELQGPAGLASWGRAGPAAHPEFSSSRISALVCGH